MYLHTDCCLFSTFQQFINQLLNNIQYEARIFVRVFYGQVFDLSFPARQNPELIKVRSELCKCRYLEDPFKQKLKYYIAIASDTKNHIS